jgi:hypothetical protein
MTKKKIRKRLRKAQPGSVVQVVWEDAWNANGWFDPEIVVPSRLQCVTVGFLHAVSKKTLVVVSTINEGQVGSPWAIPMSWIQDVRVAS